MSLSSYFFPKQKEKKVKIYNRNRKIVESEIDVEDGMCFSKFLNRASQLGNKVLLIVVSPAKYPVVLAPMERFDYDNPEKDRNLDANIFFGDKILKTVDINNIGEIIMISIYDSKGVEIHNQLISFDKVVQEKTKGNDAEITLFDKKYPVTDHLFQLLRLKLQLFIFEHILNDLPAPNMFRSFMIKSQINAFNYKINGLLGLESSSVQPFLDFLPM